MPPASESAAPGRPGPDGSAAHLEVYDLESDAAEREPLSQGPLVEAGTARVAAWGALLEATRAAYPQLATVEPADRKRDVDADTARKLRALGYIED